MNSSFRYQAFTGLTWTLVLRFIAKTLGYIKIIVLARLLTPSDFGQFGIALISLSLVETFSETGLNEAIIQKSTITKRDLSTAWFILFARGLFLSIILFLASSWISTFFEINQQFIYLVCLIPIIKGFTNPGLFLWRKQLQFKNEVVYQLIASILDLVVSTIVAFSTPTPWALLTGLTAGVIGQSLISFMAPISFAIPSRKSVRYLLNFGKWINFNSILSYLTHEGDDIVVGKLLHSHALGIYQTAYKFSLLPATQITGPISLIGYPIIAAQPTSQEKLLRNFKFAWLIAYPAFFLGGLIFLFPQEIISIGLGPDWLEMTRVLQLLIIYGTARAMGGVLGWYFPAIGQPQKNTIINLIKLIVMGILLLPLILKWQLIGASISIVIASLVANALQIYLLSNQPGFNSIKLLYAPLIVLVVSIIFTAPLNLLALSPLIRLICGITLFTCLFLILALTIDRFFRDLWIQEVLPHLPRTLRNFIIRTNLQLKRRGWHDFHWRDTAHHASNLDWQNRYDKQWLHDRHDSLLPSDIQWIIDQLNQVKAKTVLEIGPGTGLLAAALSQHGFKVTVLDISQVVLHNLLDQKLSRVQGRGEYLPFGAQSFDTIVATHVLEHVDNLQVTIKEWLRVAKLGIAIIVPQESKPDIAANYHLQFFQTEAQLSQTFHLNNYNISTHTNPNDHTRYMRYFGQIDSQIQKTNTPSLPKRGKERGEL